MTSIPNSPRNRPLRLGKSILHFSALAAAALQAVGADLIQRGGPELDISLRRGQLVIDWAERTTTGVLQVASDPAGPWADVVGAEPPYSTSPSRAHRFYRLGPGTVIGPTGPVVETFAARA